MSVSNVKFFFLFSAIMLTVWSCKQEEANVIPEITVDFTVSFSDPEFTDFFANAGASALISSSDSDLGTGTGGFDDNGIILYNTGIEEFEYSAYDRTCPHCYANDAVSVAVNVEGTYAICPVCSTKYSLGASGSPLDGPGEYSLKNYHTSYTYSNLRVWNNK